MLGQLCVHLNSAILMKTGERENSMQFNTDHSWYLSVSLVFSIGFLLPGCMMHTKQASTTTLERQGDAQTLQTKSALRLITTDWTFVRECNFFHNCETTFSGSSKVVRSNGTSVGWNLIETWTLDDCGASPKDTHWYWTTNNSDSASFGWGKKDGESHHGSAFLRFTGDEGVFTARVMTESCP